VGLVFFIAIVFGLLIYILLISLNSMDDQRAKIRLQTRLINREDPIPISRKTRLFTFLDAVKTPDLFNQLVDERTVIWSGVEMTHCQYIAFWWLLSFTGVILGAVTFGFGSGDLAMGLLGFALVLFLVIGPYFYLKFRIQERKREMERSLPDFLDMLTFTVEAGLGLVPAIKRVSKGIIGVFGEELQHALVQIEMGFSRREALEELVLRNPSSDMEHFVEAILLSERLGTSLARTMRVQADMLRTRRRQRAEVKAQTAPIRIIPALVFFFLPSLLLIYLAPPIINFLFRR